MRRLINCDEDTCKFYELRFGDGACAVEKRLIFRKERQWNWGFVMVCKTFERKDGYK